VLSSELGWKKHDLAATTVAYTVNIQMERMELAGKGRARKRGKPLFIRHMVRLPLRSTIGELRKVVAEDAGWRQSRVRLRANAGDAAPIAVAVDCISLADLGIRSHVRAELLLSPEADTAVDGEEEAGGLDDRLPGEAGAESGMASGKLMDESAEAAGGDDVEQMQRALEWRSSVNASFLARKAGGDVIDGMHAKRVREFSIDSLDG